MTIKQSYKNLNNQIYLRTYSFYIYFSLVGPTKNIYIRTFKAYREGAK